MMESCLEKMETLSLGTSSNTQGIRNHSSMATYSVYLVIPVPPQDFVGSGLAMVSSLGTAKNLPHASSIPSQHVRRGRGAGRGRGSGGRGSMIKQDKAQGKAHVHGSDDSSAHSSSGSDNDNDDEPLVEDQPQDLDDQEDSHVNPTHNRSEPVSISDSDDEHAHMSMEDVPLSREHEGTPMEDSIINPESSASAPVEHATMHPPQAPVEDAVIHPPPAPVGSRGVRKRKASGTDDVGDGRLRLRTANVGVASASGPPSSMYNLTTVWVGNVAIVQRRDQASCHSAMQHFFLESVSETYLCDLCV